MRFRIPSLITALALAALSPVAGAAPYWVAWEGDDYPENEGWERRHYLPHATADRTLADGVMTLDGMASVEIVDSYRMSRPVDPGPGEVFVVEWGLRVNDVGNPHYPYDPGVLVTSDDGWHVAIVFGMGEIRSILEQETRPFATNGIDHWTLRSYDMRSYRLLLNDEPIYDGNFILTLPQSNIMWGDVVAGGTSRSDWDYFRFGIIPEAGTSTLLLALACLKCIAEITRRTI